MEKEGVGDASSLRAAAAAASSASRGGPVAGEGIQSKPKPAVGEISSEGVVGVGVGVETTVLEVKELVGSGDLVAVDGVTKPWNCAANNDAEDKGQTKPGACSEKIGEAEGAGRPGGCTAESEVEDSAAGAVETKGEEAGKPAGFYVKVKSEHQGPMEPRDCSVKSKMEEQGPVVAEVLLETKLRKLFDEACGCMEATEQDQILRGILLFKCCGRIVNEMGLLSSKDYVSTNHLKYILISYYIGDLNEKVAGHDRMAVISTSLDYLKKYVSTCRTLKIIPEDELDFCNEEQSVAKGKQRNHRKVARFKRQRALEVKLKKIEKIRKDDISIDCESYDRERWTALISLSICKAFDLIETLTLEEELEEEYDLTCLHDLFVCEHECAIPLRKKLEGIKLVERIGVPGRLDIPRNDIEPEMSDSTPLARIAFQGMVDIQYRLHREKLSLNGCFTYDDFYWTDQKKVKLAYHLRKLVSRRTLEKVRKDYSVNRDIMMKDILGQVLVPLPTDLSYVMDLMLEDPIRGEALLRYSMCWMDHISKMSHFITMYRRFEQLLKDPERSYKCEEILSYISAGNEEWKVELFGNKYLKMVSQKHDRDSDPTRRNSESSGAKDLLEFVRHCITHILDHSLEENRIVLFEVHVYYIIESCFNGVFVQFQRGMHAVGELEYPHLTEIMKA